jgi:hypothetical protein
MNMPPHCLGSEAAAPMAPATLREMNQVGLLEMISLHFSICFVTVNPKELHMLS